MDVQASRFVDGCTEGRRREHSRRSRQAQTRAQTKWSKDKRKSVRQRHDLQGKAVVLIAIVVVVDDDGDSDSGRIAVILTREGVGEV